MKIIFIARLVLPKGRRGKQKNQRRRGQITYTAMREDTNDATTRVEIAFRRLLPDKFKALPIQVQRAR